MKGLNKFFCVVAVAAVAVFGIHSNALAASSNQQGILRAALQDMFGDPEGCGPRWVLDHAAILAGFWWFWV